jgi:hypothetical protein
MASGVKEAGASMKNVFANAGSMFAPITGQLSGLSTGILDGVRSFKAMAPAITEVKTAFMATGIGAIVIGLATGFAALASYLTGTAEGSDKLNKILGYAKGIFTAILNRVQLLGEAISLVFKGKFGEAGQKLKEAFSGGLLAEIKETANESMSLATRENKLTADKIANIRVESDLVQRVSDLREKASDRENYSAEQRLKYSKQAESLDLQISGTRIKMAKEEYEILTAKNALGNNTHEDNKKEAEAYASMVGMQTELNNKKKEYNLEQRKINSNINAEIAAQQKLNAEIQLSKKLYSESLKPVKSYDVAGETTKKDKFTVFETLQKRNAAAQEQSLIDIENFNADQQQKIQSMNSVAISGINNLGIGISEAFADIITGKAGSGFDALFSGILSTVGDFAKQMGSAILAYGVAMEGFKKAFTNPYAAIAAGLALIVTGGIVKNLASNIGAKKYANGGIVPGFSYSGDNVHAMVNSGEMILNRSQQSNLFKMVNGGGSGGGQRLLAKVQAREELIMLQNENKFNNSGR